jgi:hypothetical protein
LINNEHAALYLKKKNSMTHLYIQIELPDDFSSGGFEDCHGANGVFKSRDLQNMGHDDGYGASRVGPK